MSIPVQQRLSDTSNMFCLFPDLPPELRLIIWKFTLPTTGRIVPYFADEIPSAAFINRESRSVYLSFYSKCFLAGSTSESENGYPFTLYANLSQDVFAVYWMSTLVQNLMRLTPQAIVGMRHVYHYICGYSTPAGLARVIDGSIKRLQKCSNLETYVLVLAPDQKKFRKQLEDIKTLRESPLVKIEVLDNEDWIGGRGLRGI